MAFATIAQCGGDIAQPLWSSNKLTKPNAVTMVESRVV